MERGTQKPTNFPGREQYLLIHKHLVGPKTAERLFLLYETLEKTPHTEAQYMAGWTAAEAALVATDRPIRDRLTMLDAAEEAWDFATDLSMDSAIRKADGGRPNRSTELRIKSTNVFIPTMRALVSHTYDHSVRLACFKDLLVIAQENAEELKIAERAHDLGRWGNHFGLSHEHTGLLGTNYLLSGRTLGMPSLARSGSGDNYPSKTHDMQIINLRRGRIMKATPIEAKAGLSFSYDVPVVSGRKHFKTPNALSIEYLYQCFQNHLAGQATEPEIARLEEIKTAVIHMTRHHYTKNLGKHCLRMERCALSEQVA